MDSYLSVVMTTLVVFLAMIISLAAKPETIKKLNICFVVICGISGLLIYGYGYSYSEPSIPLAMIHTLLAVCGILVGGADFDAVSATPFFQSDAAKLLFWVIHLMARYAFASAAVTVIGAELLRRMRLFLARWGSLNLIYGLNGDSFAFGKNLMEEGQSTVVYIDGAGDDSLAAAVSKSRSILRADASAVNADMKFLKSVGFRPGTRKLTLYALSKDPSENLIYAKKLLASLKEIGALPEQTTLVILGKEETAISQLQVLGDQYGYGYVTVFREEGLVARLLIRNHPPCNTISFDENGRAKENFEVLQVGFGQLGQTILRNLLMNGQFEGSNFRADVFDPNYEDQIGYFANNFGQTLEKYDIRFHQCDARSRQMYDHILQRRENIKYVVLCTGSDKMNREIGDDLSDFFSHLNLDMPIHMCTYRGITTQQAGMEMRDALYRPDVLSMTLLDKRAMVLNHYYCGDNSKTPLQQWMVCDYFSRMSSRASADFADAMLHCVGKTREQVLAGNWELSEAQLENLSRTEHLRWCAFHYCMGFSPMSSEEYDRRAREYKMQLEREGKATIRIGKNLPGRTHACLINWEELDELSRKENRITGKNVDYKDMDRNNVRIIPEMLSLDAQTHV